MADRLIKCKRCGGNVRGVRDMGQLFTWCTKCTPVVRIEVNQCEAITKTCGGGTQPKNQPKES